MTSKQRQFAAMRRQEPDRVPIYIRGVNPHDPAWVASRHPSYAPLIAAVEEYGDVRSGVGFGGGWLMTAADLPTSTDRQPAGDWLLVTTTIHTPAGDLATRRYDSPAGHPGMTCEFPVKTERDVARALSIPYHPPQPPVEEWLGAVAAIGERGQVHIGFGNPIAHVHDLLGSTLLAEWSITQRELVARLTRIFAERLDDILGRWLDDPRVVEPVFAATGHEYAGPPLLSPRDFREFCTDIEQPIFDRIHRRGGLLHVHCHGPMDAIIEQLAELGADCLHPVEAPPMGDITLAQAKARVGRNMCLEGNIQMDDIFTMDPRDFVAVVEAAMRDGKPGAGFILAPTASPYTPALADRARDNYLAMIETGVRLGAYR
jgi:hypothetical protein